MPVDVFGSEIQGLPNEAERDARLMQLFRHFVASQPGKFAGLVLVRLTMALLPVPVSSGAHGGSMAAMVSAWYIKGTPLIAVGAALLWLKGRLWWRAMPLVIFAGYWALMQSLAGPGLRYRLPADPVWACMVGIVAAAALVRLWPDARQDPLARRWVRAHRVAGRVEA
jgi:hypothetical protein